MKGNLWTVVVVALFLAILLPAVNLGYQDTTKTATANTEAVTVDYSENTTVDNADTATSFYDNETIQTDGGNTTLEDGIDYEWNTTTGEIQWLNTTATTDGDTATITYTYQYHGQTTSNIAALLQPWGTILGVFLFVTVLGYFVNAALGGGGF